MSRRLLLGGVLGALGIGSVYLGKQYSVYKSMDADWTTYHSTIKKEFFEGRKVWITGATSGIGKAMVYYLASLNCANMQLIISARRETILNEIKADLISNSQYNLQSKDVYCLPLDCSEKRGQYYSEKYESIKTYFDDCTNIDILVNNAGFSMRSYCIDLDVSDTIDMTQTNLATPILLTKLVFSDIIKNNAKSKDSKFGHVVNVSSIAGRFQAGCRTTYCSTKSGLIAFGDSLNDELLPYSGLGVTTVLPGPTATDVDITAKGKLGVGHNKRDSRIQSGMSAQRCAELICIAMSNRVFEHWPCQQPILQRMYAVYYAPWYYYKYMKSATTLKALNAQAGYEDIEIATVQSKL